MDVTVATATPYVKLVMHTVATATHARVIVPLMDGTAKSLRDERLRALLRDLQDNRYKTTAALARALGVQGPTITEVLNGKRGVGLDLLCAISRLTGDSLDTLVGHKTARSALADLPQWPTARAAAERRLSDRRPELVREALDRVGRFGPPDFPVLLTELAEAVMEKPSDF